MSRADVVEDLREEGLALRPGLERRRRRPGVGHRDVGRSRVAPCGELLDSLLGAGRRDRIRGRRPTRLLDDRKHLPRHDEEKCRERDADDCQHGPPPTPQTPRCRRARLRNWRRLIVTWRCRIVPVHRLTFSRQISHSSARPDHVLPYASDVHPPSALRCDVPESSQEFYTSFKLPAAVLHNRCDDHDEREPVCRPTD